MPVTEGIFDLSKSILTVSSSVRGGSREKIKIHIVCEIKKSTTCEHKRQKEKKGAVKQHTGRLKKGKRKEEKNKKE